MAALPELMGDSPVIILIVVVFPAPLGPKKPTISLALPLKLRWLTTVRFL